MWTEFRVLVDRGWLERCCWGPLGGQGTFSDRQKVYISRQEKMHKGTPSPDLGLLLFSGQIQPLLRRTESLFCNKAGARCVTWFREFAQGLLRASP